MENKKNKKGKFNINELDKGKSNKNDKKSPKTKRNLEESVFEGKMNSQLIFRIIKQVGGKWPLLVGFLAAILLCAFCDSINTYISKFIIDRGIIDGDREQLIFYSAISFGIFVVGSISIFLFILAAGRLGEHVQFELRKQLFAHMQNLSFSFFDKNSSGWLLSRITGDTRRIAELITWMFVDMTWGVVNITVALIFMATINLKLMLIVAAIMPPLILVSIKFRGLILKEYRKVRAINSEITGAYSENISGVRIVKALGREKGNLKGFSRITESMHQASFRAGWLSAFFLPVVQLITTFSVAGVLYIGSYELSSPTSSLSPGELRAFIGYILFMMWPIENLSRVFSEMQRALASAERVFSLLDTPPEITDSPGAKKNANFKGEISFKNIDFRYNSKLQEDSQNYDKKNKSDSETKNPLTQQPLVLSNFNLKVSPGEMIAIVGPTGGGKTTIVNLVARFYEPSKGTILFDGEDYRNWTQEALQKQIGVVLQDPHLFSGTIKENILYGKKDASEEEIEHAVRLAHAKSFISQLPLTYNEEVGESGNLLSMGQKQLISLARTILSDPDIIIMDEATSSIDSLTEHHIQQGMAELMKGRTSFVIAHRLSTIREATRILVIEEGKIKEMGNHAELLNRKGDYYNLYTGQMRTERKGCML